MTWFHLLTLTVMLVAWVGHACFWTYLLNILYGRPISKKILKPFRLFCGVMIAAAPLLTASAIHLDVVGNRLQIVNGPWGDFLVAYAVLICLPLGGIVFPFVTIRRLLRKRPPSLLAEATRTVDYWPRFGSDLIGDGKDRRLTRLPGNGIFRVDFTELTLAPRDLPPAWEGLTILLLSDLHFHGTPSRVFFQSVIDEISTQPPPDVVALTGDFVDTDTHHAWIGEFLGQLRWNEVGVAILGNHDKDHQPERIRESLAQAGYRVLANRWEAVTIRGESCVVVGHEGPWFGPPPDLKGVPSDGFRLCLSHTPDQFYWGQANGIHLMLCGHVHGGQIRVPVVGSIFVPSVYSRRFDMGVFDEGGTLMVVSRGVSGKEPIRLRCHPQVIRITLKSQSASGVSSGNEPSA